MKLAGRFTFVILFGTAAFALTANNYYDTAARQYIFEMDSDCMKTIKEGLRAFPGDPKLESLKGKLKKRNKDKQQKQKTPKNQQQKPDSTQQQKQKKQTKPGEMSEEEAKRLLDAFKDSEKEAKKKEQKKVRGRYRVDKDW